MPPIPVFVYRSIITRVIDGDTVEAQLDLGCSVYHTMVLRLLGINAPEVEGPQKPQGDAARAYAESLMPPNTSAVIATQKDQNDKYGRLLATIWLNDGRNVNQLMVSSNNAAAYDGHGPKPIPTPAPTALTQTTP